MRLFTEGWDGSAVERVRKWEWGSRGGGATFT